MDVITRHRLTMLDLEPADLAGSTVEERVQIIYTAFIGRIPYENLSNNRCIAEQPDDPDAWPRATDRLLRENAAYGLGGTSFSLSYALRDLFRGAGANAHCTLGYNLVTEQPHAAVIVYIDGRPVLYDPALLMCGPLPVRPNGEMHDPLGCFRLVPRVGPTLTVTLTLCDRLTETRVTLDEPWAAPGPRGVDRPIYSIIPIPAAPHNFRAAWLASFHRGRAMPLRLARRVGNEIFRYGERPNCVEILRVTGREEVLLGAQPVDDLEAMFSIDRDCLVHWFCSGPS